MTLAALTGFTKLAINGGHKSSLYQEFDHVLQVTGKSRKFSGFKEHRFAEMGYTAAAIIYHLDEFNAILENPRSNNQLVQACELYTNNDFILVALKCMAWFTLKVTLPFLNMCELQKQSDLLPIMSQLKLDLESLKMNTLVEFEVDFSFKVDEPDSVLTKHILEEFCKQAAIDLITQRGREYGFTEHEKSRATNINEIPKEQVDYMPVNILDCERDLVKFNQLAKRSAMCSSKKFKAKPRDEMTLIQAENIKIEKITKNIAKVLDDEEKIWVKSQNLLHEQKSKKDAEKATHQFEYVNSLLTRCKKHGGPFALTEEVEQCLHNIVDDIEKKPILHVKILYHRHSCSSNAQQRSHLYKVNQISLTKMKVNIATLLTNNFAESLEIPPIPSEDEVVKLLSL